MNFNDSNLSTMTECPEDIAFYQKIELNRQALLNIEVEVTNRATALHDCVCANVQVSTEEAEWIQQSIETVQSERAAMAGDQSRTQRELATLTADFRRLAKALAGKEEERVQKEGRLEDLQGGVTAKQSLLEDIAAHNKTQEHTVGLGVRLFEKNLGLKITRTSSQDTTILSFTQLHRSDPERVFKVSVQLVGDRYVLTSDPPLPALPALQAALNKTNNLPAFLVTARKLFKKMELEQ